MTAIRKYVSVKLDVEKLGLQSNKTTYDDIKAYISNKYGFKIPSIYSTGKEQAWNKGTGKLQHRKWKG